MTWQRIDENTYIDDTLVTCAEYQLFIDEMREHGRYYQPDHWTEYQFPEGQAKEPVLGVRQRDAIAFCEWLTKRETSEWSYRVPKIREVENTIIKSTNNLPMGYWVIETKKKQKLLWIGKKPDNARRIVLDSVLDRSLVRKRSLDFILDNLAYDADSVVAKKLRNTVDRSRSNDLARGIAHAFERAITRNSARVFDLDHTLSILNIAELSQSFNVPQAFNRAIPIDIHANAIKSFDPIRYLANSNVRMQDMALDIFADILTLRERIAGRSPAFEGIRLVKERIR